MTDHDLAHLRELESAATRGPWTSRRLPGGGLAREAEVRSDAIDGSELDDTIADVLEAADAALVAAMRNELPWLLDQAERAAFFESELAICERTSQRNADAHMVSAAENARLRERLARVEAAVERVRKRHPRGDEESSILAPGLWCPTCGRERGDNGYGACPDRAALAEPDAPEGSESDCDACATCIGIKPVAPGSLLTIGMTRMITCPECSNKRCPHATDHRNACTHSNEPGQVGSRYTSGAGS